MASSDSVDYKSKEKPYWDTINKRTGKPIKQTMVENKKDERFLRPYLNDEIVVEVIEKIKTRADKGMSKYGVPMTREDVTTIEWLHHAQQEAMDLAIYLERCIADLKRKEPLRV